MVNAPVLKAGVMGWPISHSLSPRLHVFWLQLYGIQGEYEAVPVQPGELREALGSLRTKGWRGVNLTIPHKQDALTIVDELDPAARRIGACNLVTVEKDGTLLGHNTDAYGFMQNLLQSGFRRESGIALVLGAGGAARAVVIALQDMGFREIRLVNRTRANADALVRSLTTNECRLISFEWSDSLRAQADIDLLVNATSLGMVNQPALDYSLGGLPMAATVTDVVYTPLETALLRQARLKKHMTIDGLGMLLHQARPAFAAFYGRDPHVTAELRQEILGSQL